MNEMSQIDRDRFWSKASPSPSGCLEWYRAKTNHGYGAFQYKGQALKAHRVAYELHYGIDPAGKFVCHKCDNPCCIKPEHLFLGTALDNNNDMRAKGRDNFTGPTNPPVGEDRHNSLLTEEEVIRIRIIGSAITQPELGKAFGVSRQTISAVLRRESWKHI
jgi:hypothetical protein